MLSLIGVGVGRGHALNCFWRLLLSLYLSRDVLQVRLLAFVILRRGGHHNCSVYTSFYLSDAVTHKVL